MKRFSWPVCLSMAVLGMLSGWAAGENEAQDPSQDPVSVPLHTAGTVRYVVGLTPFLDDELKNEVYRGIVRFVLEELPTPSSLAVYDAYHIRSIAQVEIPDVRAFRSSRTRANQFKDSLQALRQFLAKPPERPEVKGMDFRQAIRLPQFLDFVSQNLVAQGRAVRVLMLGSPLHLDAKEPGFSMWDGYYPSDGHLLATREKSVYGLAERRTALPAVTVHWGYPGDPWTSAIHQEKVHRFWSLYLARQGGRLATFTGDLPTVFNAMRAAGSAEPDTTDAPCRFEIDESQTKVEMVRMTRDTGVTDWIAHDRPGRVAQGPPRISRGPMKIGIRWQADIDLDLYARPKPRAEMLSFEHTRSPEGYYFKDHRSSPEREYEFIEFLEPVEVSEVEASINFYEGRTQDGVEGEVRVEFDGRIYSRPFSIAASRGNRGREGAGQEAYWAPVDILALLKLR